MHIIIENSNISLQEVNFNEEQAFPNKSHFIKLKLNEHQKLDDTLIDLIYDLFNDASSTACYIGCNYL
jgi:hypothetical protein